MSDELTRAIAEALSLGCGCLTRPDRPDGGDSFGCYCECGDEGREDCDHDQPQRITAALAPLIEARVREARAGGAADAYADVMRRAADESMACRRVAEDARND